MPNNLPSDDDLRKAIHDIRLAWMTCKLIGDRLAWEATNATLAADTLHIVIADELVNRPGS